MAENQNKKRYDELLEKMQSLKLYDAELLMKNIYEFYTAFKIEEKVKLNLIYAFQNIKLFYTN